MAEAELLVACEEYGKVRDAFLAVGISAISCDLNPSKSPGPHIQDDVRNHLNDGYRMVIAHPPCTRLCNSGVRWLHERDLWDDLRLAAEFFSECLNADAPMVAVENPVMHRYARELVGRGPDFAVQPYHFGEPTTKKTCFWTRGLPPICPPLLGASWYAEAVVHRMPPGPDRSKRRSITSSAIAEAMAVQWGELLR